MSLNGYILREYFVAGEAGFVLDTYCVLEMSSIVFLRGFGECGLVWMSRINGSNMIKVFRAQGSDMALKWVLFLVF